MGTDQSKQEKDDAAAAADSVDSLSDFDANVADEKYA